MLTIQGHKVIVSRQGIAAFNAVWPCSELRSSRAYWFEFDERGDLIDTDCPEQDDGAAAVALADDCKRYLFDDEQPSWASLKATVRLIETGRDDDGTIVLAVVPT